MAGASGRLLVGDWGWLAHGLPAVNFSDTPCVCKFGELWGFCWSPDSSAQSTLDSPNPCQSQHPHLVSHIPLPHSACQSGRRKISWGWARGWGLRPEFSS